MKKILFALVFLSAFCGAVKAEELAFQPFRVDVGAGYGFPLHSSGGVGFYYAEAKYEVMPKLSLGLRYQGEGAVTASEEEVGIDMGYAALVTADYFFNDNKFRPFVGLGLGGYWLTGGKTDGGGGDAGSDLTFGALARLGFDIDHIRIAASYNYGGQHLGRTYHYAGFSIGMYFGGGKY